LLVLLLFLKMSWWSKKLTVTRLAAGESVPTPTERAQSDEDCGVLGEA
jgi:hypothetical protein